MIQHCSNDVTGKVHVSEHSEAVQFHRALSACTTKNCFRPVQESQSNCVYRLIID